MLVNWGTALRPKYISLIFGKEWEASDFKLLSFRKTPLGWDMNLWRFSISYDNHGNVKQ